MKNKSFESIKLFIIDLLTSDTPLPISKNKLNEFRYLDAGQIDSLNLIRFIMSIEKKFEIKLTEKDTNSDEFRYVEGLIKIIQKKINKKKTPTKKNSF